MKHKIRNENNGFTLIELVITIAVLAVISVPLLMYFTDSMRHSARMKEEQNAVVAAQNVLEELKVVDMSLDDVNNLTLAVTPPPGETPCPTTSVMWEEVPGVTPGPGETPAPAGSSYEVWGNYMLNNQSYTVKAKITPRDRVEGTAAPTPDTKKVYHKAKAPSMNSSKDMIITEKSTVIEDAKMFFYDQYTKYCDDPSHGVSRDPSITIDSMEKSLERVIHIKAEPEKDDAGTPTGSGKIFLTASYEYKWKGTSYIYGVDGTTRYSTVIKTAILEGIGEHNIFLFYTPINYMNGAALNVVSDKVVLEGSLAQLTNGTLPDGTANIITGNPGTGSKELQYHLYLVECDVDVSGVAGYQTTISASSGENFGDYISEVYTNLTSSMLDTATYVISNTFPASAGTDNGFHCDRLLDSPEVNRVAEIEVSVYKDKGDFVTSINENNRYTTVNGTKVQSQ